MNPILLLDKINSDNVFDINTFLKALSFVKEKLILTKVSIIQLIAHLLIIKFII